MKIIKDNTSVIIICMWLVIFVMNIFILEQIGLLMLFLASLTITTSQLQIMKLEGKIK
jgi:hypothetical protein